MHSRFSRLYRDSMNNLDLFDIYGNVEKKKKT